MKCKVKGLVFVGFAAAILAGAAHAEGENIVTSKAYTDATYQAKSTGLSVGNTGGIWTAADTTVAEGATSIPTTAAVKSYVDTQIGTAGGNYQTKSTAAQMVSDGDGGWQALTKDTTVTQNSSNPVTSGAVYNALNDTTNGHVVYQAYSSTANQISNGAGGWKDLDSVIDNTTASSASAPTTAAVKTYVDNQATTAASSILTGTQDATDTSHALTNAATTTALAGKQDNLGGTGNGGKVVTASETEGSVTYTAIDNTVTSGSSNLVTSDAVYDALNGAEHSNFQTYSSTAHQISNGAGGWEALDATINATTAAAGTAPTTGAVKSYVDSAIAAQPASNIPAQNPAICTNTEPCALVSENGNYNWRVMAVSSNQTSPAGTCGNVGGQCPTTAPANNG